MKSKPFYCPRCGTKHDGVDLNKTVDQNLRAVVTCDGCESELTVSLANDWDYFLIGCYGESLTSNSMLDRCEGCENCEGNCHDL